MLQRLRAEVFYFTGQHTTKFNVRTRVILSPVKYPRETGDEQDDAKSNNTVVHVVGCYGNFRGKDE